YFDVPERQLLAIEIGGRPIGVLTRGDLQNLVQRCARLAYFRGNPEIVVACPAAAGIGAITPFKPCYIFVNFVPSSASSGSLGLSGWHPLPTPAAPPLLISTMIP